MLDTDFVEDPSVVAASSDRALSNAIALEKVYSTLLYIF
jgi:hypothetical protein